MHTPGFLHWPGGRSNRDDEPDHRLSLLAVDSDVGRPAEDTIAALGVRPASDPAMALRATRRQRGAARRSTRRSRPTPVA